MKKTLTALAIAGSLTFLGAGVAQANTYPDAPIATVSDNVVAPGEPFVFQGAGFIPGETIIITVTLTTEPSAAGVGGIGVGGALGAGVTGVIAPATVLDAEGQTVTAEADGTFATEITLSQPGSYLITAEGQESGLTRSASVEVVAVDGAAVPGDTTGGTGAGSSDDLAANENAVANGDQLANTGLESSALLWGGAGVLALGAGATAVVVSRRKNA